MYRAKVVHPFAQDATADEMPLDALWSLFVAIGDHWSLGDDAERYRLRFESFIENRIALNPLYSQTYRDAGAFIDGMVAGLGHAAAFEKIFTEKPRISPNGTPTTPLETVQRFVVNEFITLRLALGSFKAFGALNYPGYPAGANIEGQPIPYRSKERL